MEQRFVDILEKTYTNPKTRENYKTRLTTLMRKLDAPSLLEVLQNPDTYYPKLQAVYPSLTTRKNMLTPLLALIREDTELRTSMDMEEARTQWRKLHDDLHKHQDARIRRSEPADKQIAKYTSFEEIEAKYEELKKAGGHTTRRSSMHFVLLSILVHMRPKRADLGSVHIFVEQDPNRKDINYIVLRNKGISFLAMNLYKTSKHYATVEEDLPDGLKRDIVRSLKRWPREYLFVKENMEAMSNNTYSHFVSTTFEDLFGRGTGVSLLRHIYISEKLDLDNMTLEEQEEEARYMLHTSGLQRQYKWPKKVLCPKLCSEYLPPTKRTRRVRQSLSKAETRRKRRLGGSHTNGIEHL
jgi:hypothetical protein